MTVEKRPTTIPTHVETARLSFEVPTEADDEIQQSMLNDPINMAHLRFMSKEEKGGWTLTDIANRREGHLKAIQELKGASFLVHLKSTGEIIGSVNSPVLHYDNRNAHVGVMIKKEYRSGGYGTEALCAYMGMLFEDLKLHKVIYETVESNTGMRTFLEQACGTPVTYIMKDDILCPSTKKWVSLWVYVIYEDAWPQIKANLLDKLSRGAAKQKADQM